VAAAIAAASRVTPLECTPPRPTPNASDHRGSLAAQPPAPVGRPASQRFQALRSSSKGNATVFSLRAPIAGSVTHRAGLPGQAVTPESSVATIVSIDRAWFVARIFERGVGETLSSGTGATGAAVAAHLRGMSSPINVELDGGELLVGIDDKLNITLTGWAKPVFDGELTAEFISELEQL